MTGAGRGIGREHALLLAREGAAVMVNDLGGDGRGEGQDLTPAQRVADEIRSFGGKAEVNGANVADWAAAEGLVAQTVEAFGKLDILVNNAGILRDRMSFNLGEDEWDAVLNVVLKGSFAPSRFAATYWREQTKKTQEPINGAIVNTSSESGLYGNAGQANYASAKAGLVAMSLVMARELERIGVRVNAIAPLAATRLLGTVIQPEEGSAEKRDTMSPAEISPLVAWLCSDLAKDVNGQVFAVSGERIQRIQGHHPVTEIPAGDESWSIERIEGARGDLLGSASSWIPAFLPPVS
ncbi:SDR family oxidoreductase [Acidiferrimicrobium sp. IK]|nr:SDR family NAD(P)-dependent oxidoreductase [Acidiferrimicrobium sp. IK]MCU4183487.1 SDR family oxidoreductase [Acidiferrimicrobium sp. IK]